MNMRIAKAIPIVVFVALLSVSLARGASGKSAESVSAADESAIKQIVAGFSNGWNSHDARSMCMSMADNVEWVNWRGEASHTRKEVEDEHARLFAGLYKNTHRTDTVKSIRYLTPELVSVENYWSMTGAKNRDGSDWPYREGYASYVMAKRNGRWVIIISHTADFNAKAPRSGK